MHGQGTFDKVMAFLADHGGDVTTEHVVAGTGCDPQEVRMALVTIAMNDDEMRAYLVDKLLTGSL